MASSYTSASHIVWLDLESTGGNPDIDHVLQIACIITDRHLETVTEGMHVVLHQPKEVLDNMHPYCIQQYVKSGLIEKCLNSTITIPEAESIVLEYLKKHIPRSRCSMAGNCVHVDRSFLRKYFSAIDKYLFYRIIDVATIKELALRWYPYLARHAPKKQHSLHSLHHIEDHIAELKYYRKEIFAKHK